MYYVRIREWTHYIICRIHLYKWTGEHGQNTVHCTTKGSQTRVFRHERKTIGMYKDHQSKVNDRTAASMQQGSQRFS